MVEYYWSRVPGRFVNSKSGRPIEGKKFNGTVREWYEGIVNTISEAMRATGADNVELHANDMMMVILQATLAWRPDFGSGAKDTEGRLSCGYGPGPVKTVIDNSIRQNELRIISGNKKLGRVVIADPTII